MKSLTIHQHTKIQDLAEFFNNVGDADRVRGEKLDNGLTRLYIRDRSFLTVIKEHLFEDDKLRVETSRTLAKKCHPGSVESTGRRNDDRCGHAAH